MVDFRAKEFLRQNPENDTAPLIYPCHFNGGFVHWPKEKARKPNAIVNNERTRELLVPAGVYVLVKRFSAKEERKRIVACIYDSHQIHAPLVGFENHLNYFHINGHGLPMALAKGLAAFLNSTVVDVYFRQFNGHTQVNATDLRSLNYPSKAEAGKSGPQNHRPGFAASGTRRFGGGRTFLMAKVKTTRPGKSARGKTSRRDGNLEGARLRRKAKQ